MTAHPLIQPGVIILSSVDLVVDDPHAKALLVDCHSKYFEIYTASTGVAVYSNGKLGFRW